ncbi:MAG: hypothetical protein ACR2Q4_09270 [Geminicoccaceae bacterium]
MAWFERHSRWTFHVALAPGSWLNAVESFFSAAISQDLKRCVIHSVVDVQAAIKRIFYQHNDDPKPFASAKSAQIIAGKLNRLGAS